MKLFLLLSLAMARKPTCKEQLSDLELRVAALEAELEVLKQAPPPTSERASEGAAEALREDAQRAFDNALFEDSGTLLEKLRLEHPGSVEITRAKRLERELSVIGKQVPSDWHSHVKDWLVPDPELALEQGLVMLIYWELWCPHCRRELPKLQATYARYRAQGLQVVGLTRITKSSTMETARQFLADHEIAFAVAQEDGQLKDFAEVTGIPAMVVMRDGHVIWRGHPARLKDAQVETWLGQ